MGRKLQSKQTSKKRNSKEGNKFIQQKRKELSNLVDKLLKLTSIFHATGTVNKSWEHHLQVEALIKDIINIETPLVKNEQNQRKLNIEKYVSWLNENGAEFEGVEISDFEGYELGLKATKEFEANSLILTVPCKLMMSEKSAKESELGAFVNIDPLLQNMPNITLALFLLHEKSNSDSFWKPYIDFLPEKYSTVLYYTSDELAELRPSPTFESSLKLYRSIARQYAYFYNKIHTLDLPVLKNLHDIFTFENYRWAVSTVMTRQNNIQLDAAPATAFIPLWDMCNHEHGKITTNYNEELNRGECFALRDFKPGEQIFIFYGARQNSDLFLHNGFVYHQNEQDGLSLALGVSSGDPLREAKLGLLVKLGLAGLTHFNLYKRSDPISAELLAFIRIFNMNKEELEKWSNQSMPCELVSSDESSSASVGPEIDRKAYNYLLTRCGLIKATYKDIGEETASIHRKNIIMLKKCEVQILDIAIEYLKKVLEKFPTENNNTTS